MKFDQRDLRALEAAKLYYKAGYSQSEVAKALNLSRPTVSKLLQYARESGWVEITIHDPRDRIESLQSLIREHFQLEKVIVVCPPAHDSASLLDELGLGGAKMLAKVIQPEMKLGVGWGKTMRAVARHLAAQDLAGITIVQLKGGQSHSQVQTNDNQIMELFCRAFSAPGLFLQLPVVFDSLEVKQIVEKDRHIQRVLEAGRQVDTAIFTVGSVTPDSALLNLGYCSASEQEQLLAQAAGDICSRFYDRAGKICLPDLDARTVAITLPDLLQRPHRILVAGGARKAEAIKTALENGFATHLVIDEATARSLLK